MGLVLIIPVCAAAIWIIFSSFRGILRKELPPHWKQRAIILTLAGIALGTWFAFFRQTEIGPLRLAGFPVPTTIVRFEEEMWKDFSPPFAIQILGRAANFLTGIAAALLPVKIAMFIRQFKAASEKR